MYHKVINFLHEDTILHESCSLTEWEEIYLHAHFNSQEDDEQLLSWIYNYQIYLN